jgi:peptidoglycan/xylan/chitin deacetylase (PgdA/CDA1 family)
MRQNRQFICAFGSHGLTHTDLTSLDLSHLDEELVQSRAYLEDTLSLPVNTVALPGGKGDSRVLSAAVNAGYCLVCNSVADINCRIGLSVNRPCVTSDEDAMLPLRWAQAELVYWQAKRLRHAITGVAVRILGERIYGMATSVIKG